MIGRATTTVLLLLLVRTSTAALRLVDLSYQTNENMTSWPINPPYKFTIMNRGFWGATKLWLENNFFAQPEHAGTHVDAPAHFGKGSLKMHQLSMKDLSGPGVIINVKAKAASNPDYGVTVNDIKAYEEKYGRIPYGSVVIMNSGWFYRYPDKERIFNSKNLSDTDSFHFPGWLHETAKWLIDKRMINILGSDAPSYDVAQNGGSFPVHQLLSKENIVGAENVAYLDKIPESGSTIYMPALKIYDGSGAPSRTFATFDDGVNNGVGRHCFSFCSLIISLFVVTALSYI